MNNFTLPTCVLALLLSACGSADRQPTPPVAEVVRTCESIRSDIIKLAGERGFTIVKIYEPTTIKNRAQESQLHWQGSGRNWRGSEDLLP